MKNIVKISTIAIMLSGLVEAEEMKKYEVKSAKIEYELKGSGNMMGGMVKIQSVGKKRLVFDNYGLKELSEENKVTKNTTMGKTKVDKTHVLNYVNGSIVYGVDFKQKRIHRMQNPMSALAGLFGGGSSSQTSEEMLKKMGGKKIGTEKVAGYTCDVWNLSGIKQCLYKGIPLKIESNIMGLKNVEIATSAKFDIALKKDAFKLPDYSVYGMESPKPLDKSKLEAMDKEDNKKIKNENKESREMLKEASKNGLLPTIKKKMLKQETMMLFGKKCLSKAETLKEANECTQKANEMVGNSDDFEKNFEKWNNNIKNETLGDIDKGLKNMNCVKEAKNMKELGLCMK